jgi:hypothetical protein
LLAAAGGLDDVMEPLEQDNSPMVPQYLTGVFGSVGGNQRTEDELIEGDADEEANAAPEDLGDSDDEDPMVDDVAQSALEHLTTAANEDIMVKIADTTSMSVDMATIVNGLRDLTTGPAGWTPAPRKEDRGEPAFDELDNPGNWTPFCFRPEFKKSFRHNALCPSFIAYWLQSSTH